MKDKGEGKLFAAVLMGGWSREHAVSLKSGAAVFDNLSAERYERRAVLITMDRMVKLLPPGTAPASEAWQAAEGMTFLQAFDELVEWGLDVAVLALHGKGGEDGVIQGFLETLGVPYTHSDVLGSAVAMNKEISKRLYAAHGVTGPPYVVVREGDDVEAVLTRAGLGWPVVAKPPALGSSFGVHIVSDLDELRAVLPELWAVDSRVIIEKCIKGKEFTCVVLNRRFGAPAEALPVTEVVPVSSEFFDYEAKYTAGATREITPARIDAALARRIQECAAGCHEMLKCGGVTRTDFILSDEGELFALETNTIPGMTETSFVPQVAAVVGMSFGELLDVLVDYAIERKEKQAAGCGNR